MKDFAFFFWPLGWMFMISWGFVFWGLMTDRYRRWHRDNLKELIMLMVCVVILPWAVVAWMFLDLAVPQPAPLRIKIRKD